MRQYKFRGKRVDNGEWVYGKLFFLDNPKYYSILPIGSDVYPEISADGETGRYLIEPVEVIPETIGQFTGLHDENGVEIYEGDIVFIKGEDDNGTIVWDSEELEYGVDMEDVQIKLGCFYEFEVEVIGNIHDEE